MPTKSVTPSVEELGVAGGQIPHMTGQVETARQQRVRDPVCGMEISPGEAAASAEVDQRRYWFCSSHCEKSFLANPAQYIPHPSHEHARVGASTPTTAAATPAAGGAKQLAKDPICGMMVDKATALSTERGNRKYYFCSESCLRTFESPESELKAMKTRVTIALTGVLALAVLRAGAFLALAAGATLLTWAQFRLCHGSPGACGYFCWSRRCNSLVAGASIKARGMPFEPATSTWTSSSPWGRPWPTSTVWWCCSSQLGCQ